MSTHAEFKPTIGIRGLYTMFAAAKGGPYKCTVEEYLNAGGVLPKGLTLPLDTVLEYVPESAATMYFEEVE